MASNQEQIETILKPTDSANPSQLYTLEKVVYPFEMKQQDQKNANEVNFEAVQPQNIFISEVANEPQRIVSNDCHHLLVQRPIEFQSRTELLSTRNQCMVIVKNVASKGFISRKLSQARSLKRLKVAKISIASTQEAQQKPIYVKPICGDRAQYLSNMVSGQNYKTSKSFNNTPRLSNRCLRSKLDETSTQYLSLTNRTESLRVPVPSSPKHKITNSQLVNNRDHNLTMIKEQQLQADQVSSTYLQISKKPFSSSDRVKSSKVSRDIYSLKRQQKTKTFGNVDYNKVESVKPFKTSLLITPKVGIEGQKTISPVSQELPPNSNNEQAFIKVSSEEQAVQHMNQYQSKKDYRQNNVSSIHQRASKFKQKLNIAVVELGSQNNSIINEKNNFTVTQHFASRNRALSCFHQTGPSNTQFIPQTPVIMSGIIQNQIVTQRNLEQNNFLHKDECLASEKNSTTANDSAPSLPKLIMMQTEGFKLENCQIQEQKVEQVKQNATTSSQRDLFNRSNLQWNLKVIKQNQHQAALEKRQQIPKLPFKIQKASEPTKVSVLSVSATPDAEQFQPQTKIDFQTFLKNALERPKAYN